MNIEYVSLSSVAENLRIYEKLPVHIQSGLRRSVEITLITNIVSIPLLLFLPGIIESIAPVSSDGFFLWFTADVANFLFELAYNISGFLLALNVISFVLTVVVLATSWGMTKPVQEPVHWIAWVAAFPSGLSAVSAIIIVVLFVLLVIVATILWALLIALICAIIVGFLNYS